jgi:4-amino-4-deoxy-L-arabinose transferase-like glycosyltransferase
LLAAKIASVDMMSVQGRPLSARAGYALLAAVALLHATLAILYANATPYRTPGYLFVAKSRPWSAVPDIGAPDERQHANYVIHILQGKGLPVYAVMIPDPAQPGQLTRNPNLEEVYEYHQPPLYYLLTAGFSSLSGLDSTAAENPQSGLRMRYLNALFGAGTVIGVYALALWGLRRRDVALLAASITALLPMNLALSGAISNDPLLFCISTWTLAVCALAIREGWTVKRSLVVGALVGLGLLTKTTALALIPLVVVALLLRKPKWPYAASSAVVTALLVTPWFLRNQRIYGDPLGLRSFQELFAGAPKAEDLIAGLGPLTYWMDWVGWWTARSFFGVFSYMDIFLNERGNSYTGPPTNFGPAAPNTLYRILIGLAVIAIFGFLLYLRSPEAKATKRIHLLNGIFLALITVLFIRYNLSFFQGQARYFYPAIGPIAIGLSLGALYWAKSRSRLVIAAIAAGLFVLNAYALTRLPVEFQKRTRGTSSNQLG